MIVDLDRSVRRLESNGQWSDPAPLSTYRYAPAYVLLGDPGAGKSTAFERERSATPRSEAVTARDFRTIYGDPLSPETETLFIDGLDEARAGGGDPRGPFDQIRKRLKRLTPKRVRLSCREMDWLGDNDRTNLGKVVPGGEVIVLRLEPLNADEQRLIIGADPRIADPANFILEAADRGVESLLTNAQTLVLLVRVVAENGAFPEARTETFEEACRLLAREPNDDHRIAAPLPEPETLVETAGHMCAVSLLSGAAGFSVPSVRESDGFVPTSRFGANAGSAERAAHTRLFASIGGGRFVPAHANIAAFLAAQHLAGLADGPVPSGRILALLSGNDGFPPTPLRSLVAWLAATSGTLRKTLTKRDSVAVLMYGDVREFKPDEKSLVLEEIAGNPSRLYEGRWPDSALAGLASADMEPTLRSLLADPSRSDSKQQTVEIVTRALSLASSSPALTAHLPAIVLDETRSPGVRRGALDAWVRAPGDTANNSRRRRELLVHIHASPAGDPHGELLATLLRTVYPAGLSPLEVWDFFPSDPSFPQQLASEFWQELSRTCPDGHLAEHLDRLAESIGGLRPELRERLLHDVPLRLLARALETRGDEIGALRLFRWLSVGLDEACHLNDRGSDAKDLIARVRKWLEEHADIQKEVIRVALRSDEFRPRSTVGTALRELLYRSRLPDDIGEWHLDQAVRAASEDPELIEFHVQKFLAGLAAKPVGVEQDLARARERLAMSPEAVRFLGSGLKSELPDDYLNEAEAYRRAQAPDANLLRAVRGAMAPLRENRANPVLLHELARLYHAGAFEGETTDRERLLEALHGDQELTEAAIAGIRGAPDRGDLPSVERVLRLRSRQEPDGLTLPVLVGLTERSVGDVLALDDDRLGTMLALRLVRLSSDEDAAWYRECIRQRSALVAEVLLRFGRVVLAAGERHLPDLYRLSREPSYAEVARRVTMPLLRAFPVRARADQHELLTHLLQSALTHCDPKKLRDLIDRKATLASLTRTQRLYWLAAGLALDPERFGSLLSASGESYARCQVLERMFPPPQTSVHEVPGLVEKLEPAATEVLIRQLGAQRNPLRHEAGVSVGWGWTNSMGVEGHIISLGRSSESSAADALLHLADEPALSQWKRHLHRALEAQRVVRRDAIFMPPTPDDVIAALRDGPPANAADLRELIVDRVERIGKEVRTTNANLWRQFWTEDKQRNRPKGENACRDALLPLLRHRLPEGCDAQPEGQYAANRRADIRIACREWNVPVEIKKNRHADIWRTVRDQLLPRYTNDPATEGLGIYLVLWFGAQHTAPIPEGPRPQTPEELRDRLLASLIPEERRRAAVLVVDVSPP